MKRLLAQIGIAYFSVLAVAFYVSETVTLVIGCAAAAAGVLLLLIRKTRRTIFVPAVAFAVLAACAVNLGYTHLWVQPRTDRYLQGEHAVEAVLSEEPYRSYGRYYYQLHAVAVDGQRENMQVLLKTALPLDVQPDDTLYFTTTFSLSANSYYRAKGYLLLADEPEVVPQVDHAQMHTPRYYAIQVRRRFREALEAYLPEECAALCRAILIGDKYAPSDSVRDSFRFAGASYFIVVSGMHFAVLCLLIRRVLGLLKRRWLTFGVTLAFVLFYMLLTGLQPSVLRSGMMMIIYLFGTAIRRQTYSLNHLGLAGLVLPLIMSPYGAGDLGLILSFYATLAILLWAEPISRKLCVRDEYGAAYRFQPRAALRRFAAKLRGQTAQPHSPDRSGWRGVLAKLWNIPASMLSVSLAANILVFPISVVAFRAFSLVTLVSALVLYLPIYLILIIAVTLCVFFWIPLLRWLAFLCAWMLYGLCSFVLWAVRVLGDLPFAYVRIYGGWFYIWLAITVLLALVVILRRDRYRFLPTAALLSAITLLACALGNTVLSADTLTLEAYDCDGGVSVGVNSGGRLYLLSMDQGSRYYYGIMNDLSERYGGIQAVYCDDYDALEYFRLYSDNEFAICDYLLYDSKRYDFDAEHVTAFYEDSVFVLDDGLVLRTVVTEHGVLLDMLTGEREVLLLPAKCTLEDIPASMRSPDVMILSRAFDGADQLRCRDLIICGSEDRASSAAQVLRDCCENVFLTCEGDIRFDLR